MREILWLFCIILVSGCVQDTKHVFSLGNDKQCLWMKQQALVKGAFDKKDVLYYCCPNHEEKKYQPVCVETFYVRKGRREW